MSRKAGGNNDIRGKEQSKSSEHPAFLQSHGTKILKINESQQWNEELQNVE
jgi:hypothetical protein